MEFPAELEPEIEGIAQAEFNNPTETLGFKLREFIWDNTGKYLSPEVTNQLNDWQDNEELVLSWRAFINWLWERVKAWWKYYVN